MNKGIIKIGRVFILWSLLFLIFLCSCAVKEDKDKTPLQENFSSSLEVVFIDVGEGDCIFIDFPDGKRMLIDCAKDEEYAYKNIETVLKQYNVQIIDYLVL